MRTVALFGIAGLMAMCGIDALAQGSPQTLTLDQAFVRALKQHPALQQADSQIGAAKARAQQARAGMMPSFVIQGTATNGPTGAPAFGAIGNPALYGVPPLSVQGMAGDPIKKQFGGGLNITQTLFDFGRTQHLIAARRGLVGAVEEEAESQKALILLGVQQAYLNVLHAQQLTTVQQQNLLQRETTVKQARLFVEGQLKSGVDLQLALANASEANVGLLASQNDVRSTFAALNNAMGETKLTEYTLTSNIVPAIVSTPNGTPLDPPASGGKTSDPFVNPSAINQSEGKNSPLSLGRGAGGEVPTVEQAIALALTQRPELKSVALQQKAANQSIEGVRSELLPRVDAIASLGIINPNTLIRNSQNYAVGVAVSIPLYTGGLVEGRVAEEKQKRDLASAQQKQIAETVKLQVTQAWLNLQTQQAQLLSAQEQVASANASLQLASERYRLQLNSLVELTESESLTLRARAALVNAQYNLEQAHALLDWATGTTYLRYHRVVPHH